MSLDDFKLKLKSRLEAARHALSSTEFIHQQMADLLPRLRACDELATRLIREVIRPRLQATVACFPNADLASMERPNHCGAVFGYCDRFPASCNVDFSFEHDDRVENLLLRYEFRITPVFQKYEPHDRLVIDLENCREDAVAAWAESKLFGLLDDYFRVDRGEETLGEDLVTDPVCAMRIIRKVAVTQESYRGHTYFFCSDGCREQFAKEPTKYVWFRT